MEDKKEKKNKFLIILYILFIIYICLYFMNMVGYYDTNRNRTILTEEKKRQFEIDVSNGKEVDIEDYFKEQKKDYSNNFSNISLYISNSIDIIINKGLKELLKELGKLFK